jgi:hypothetical protein
MSDESSTPQPPNRPRFARRLRLPEVSGKWTVFWLLVCLIITALLIPLVLKKPLWVELEIVVVVWWLLWGVVLTKLLYKGEQIADDHQQHKARDWFGLNKEGSGSSGPDLGGCGPGVDAEGCLVLLGLIVALFLVWILIEFALPILFFMLYFLIRGMLVHAVHDKPQCQGNWSMAAFRGFLWATIYTAPLAGTIWLVHYMQMKRG